MTPRENFYRFAGRCLSRSDTGYDGDQMVDVAIEQFTIDEKKALSEFLSELLKSYTDDELRDIWRGSGSGIIILEGIRGFLEEVRKRLLNDAAHLSKD